MDTLEIQIKAFFKHSQIGLHRYPKIKSLLEFYDTSKAYHIVLERAEYEDQFNSTRKQVSC